MSSAHGQRPNGSKQGEQLPATPRGDVLARAAEFSQLGLGGPNGAGGALDVLTDIPITLTASLGKTVLTVGDILKLGEGSTVELDREVKQPVELTVGGKVFARGEVMVVNDRFAIRIKELASGPSSSSGGSQ